MKIDKHTGNPDTIRINKGRVELEVLGLKFKQSDTVFIYIPSLNISGYGSTFEEAEAMIEFSLDQFSEELMSLKNQSEITEYLSTLGWKQEFFKKKNFSHAYIDKEGALKDFGLTAEEIAAVEEEFIAI